MKLVFVGDPMCSWCYGFAHELTSVVSQTPDLELEIIVGGMGAGSTTVLDDAGKQFRLGNWARVEQASGARFNRDALMARKNFVYDTEPVCRAVVTARKLAPAASELDFFHAFQKAFYMDGLDTTDGQALAEIGVAALADANVDVSVQQFLKTWSSPEVIHATRADFQRTAALGVTGFPTVFAEKGGKLTRISSGFIPGNQLEHALTVLRAQ
jgi:putative protein-disulfide isomerase